jgi:phospholipase/lecithinase/hemolysin
MVDQDHLSRPSRPPIFPGLRREREKPGAENGGVKIHLVDINLIFTQLVYDPSKFGFSNSTGAAFNPNLQISSSNPVSDPNDNVFWDGFHPTTKAHHISAKFIYRTLVSRHVFPETLPVPLARLDLSTLAESPPK